MQSRKTTREVLAATMCVLLAVTVPCAVGCGGGARAAEVPRTSVNFQNMEFTDGFNVLAAKVGLLAYCAVLNGSYAVDAEGRLSGTGSMLFNDRPGTLITIGLLAGVLVIVIAGVSYELRNDLADEVYVDGSPTSMSGALSGALADMMTNPIGSWAGMTLFFAAIAVMFASQAFQYNLTVALLLGLGSPLLYALWVKADFILWMIAAYPLFTLGITLCAAATAACLGQPYAVVAGRRLPCAFFALICVGGVFAGVATGWAGWRTEVWQEE